MNDTFSEACGQVIVVMIDSWQDHCDGSFLFTESPFWLAVSKAISCFMFLSAGWQLECQADSPLLTHTPNSRFLHSKKSNVSRNVYNRAETIVYVKKWKVILCLSIIFHEKKKKNIYPALTGHCQILDARVVSHCTSAFCPYCKLAEFVCVCHIQNQPMGFSPLNGAPPHPLLWPRLSLDMEQRWLLQCSNQTFPA